LIFHDPEGLTPALFAAGPVETDDFHAWSQTYDAWLRVGAH
jgi:hypothetical protein